MPNFLHIVWLVELFLTHQFSSKLYINYPCIPFFPIFPIIFCIFFILLVKDILKLLTIEIMHT
jgi:hypothetical protein